MARLSRTVLATVAALLLPIGGAHAHAVSIGYANAGPGSIAVWLGTYQHGGHHLEGSLELLGVNGTVFGPTINPFTILTPDGVGNKPAGLIDGVTNFYIPDITFGSTAPLVGSEAGFNAACPACGPVNHWQGVIFSGLVEGDYRFTYIPIPFPSQEWDIINLNMNGVFHISGTVINPGVPEPGTLALVGLALAGMGAAARRRRA